MKIRRIILKGVHNFTDFDRCFEDSWNGAVPDSLLLIGPNGSGKTTLLNIIAELWQMLADAAISLQGQASRKVSNSLILSEEILIRDGLAAIEIIGLDTKSVWIISGAYNPAHNLVTQQLDSHRILVTLGVDDKGNRPYYWYSVPGNTEAVAIDKYQLPQPNPNWVTNWGLQLEENIRGVRSNMVNVVYLESEVRVLNKIKERFQVTRESENFQWLAKYEPTTNRKGSLQNYLYNLKVVDPDAFYRIIESLNTFLFDKKIIGFSPNGELMVLVDSSYRHPIEDLSAGEKQILLMLVTIHRWMRVGGIVIIDEPDLHLHVSLINAFVNHLRRMVTEKGGQLILASHAPELWQLFKRSEIVRLGKYSEEKNS